MALLAQQLKAKPKISFAVPLNLTAINISNYIQSYFHTSLVCLNRGKFVRKRLAPRKIGKSKYMNEEKLTIKLEDKEKRRKFDNKDAYFIYENSKITANEEGNFSKDYPLLIKYFNQGTYYTYYDGTSFSKPNILFVSKTIASINKKRPVNTPGYLESKPIDSTILASYKNRRFNLYPKTFFCGIPATYGILSRLSAHPENFQLKATVTVQNHFHDTTASNAKCGKNVRKDVCAAKKNQKDNLTAVLYGINDLKLEQRPIPQPKDDQVLLQMEVVGICGSDVHYLVDGRIGPFVVEKPMVIGHEASGTVVKLGKSVKNLKEGDRVAIEPGVGCRKCHNCKTGKYNLCPDMAFCATPPIDGNLARFYVHAADFCFKLPEHVSLEEGALLEPLSCAVHACKRGHVAIGSTVLILGAGPIGLTSVLAAKAFGASRIVVTDLTEYRLKLAQELGADCTIKISPNDKEGDVIQQIREAFSCKEPTVSIDCSGAEMSIRIAVEVTKAGGSAVLIGMGKTELNFPIGSAIFKEVDIRGVFRYANDYPTALEMVSTGKVKVLPLVTHEYTLEDTLKAFETAKTGKGNPIKVLIHANPKWGRQTVRNGCI